MVDTNNKIKVQTEDGQEFEFNVLFIYEDESVEPHKSYAFVYLDGENDDVMPFEYNEEDGSFLTVEDEEVFKKLEKVLEDYYQNN